MKKEIMSLLTLGTRNKTLKINGAFKLKAEYIDKSGWNVELSKKEPVDVVLYLKYTLVHDQFTCMQREIINRDYDAIVKEIACEMENMLLDQKDRLIKQFNNGYLLGEVQEDN